LEELDRQGYIVGARETATEFANRIRSLVATTETLESNLATGSCVLDGFRLRPEDRIGRGPFTEAGHETSRLYRFAIDWVPGFFQPLRGLFAGCAFSYTPDFFVLFVIRSSFRGRTRWWIYDRRELMAHELCHAARAPLQARLFEETFAYQTSASGFRRELGGMFRSAADSIVLLGSVLLLLAAQITQTCILGDRRMPFAWMYLFWGLVLAVVLRLIVRHLYYRRIFHRALANLRPVAGEDSLAVLFRCTDADVVALARCAGPDRCRAWIDNERQTVLRWRVIHARFVDRART
jgi:hypothetical protein